MCLYWWKWNKQFKIKVYSPTISPLYSQGAHPPPCCLLGCTTIFCSSSDQTNHTDVKEAASCFSCHLHLEESLHICEAGAAAQLEVPGEVGIKIQRVSLKTLVFPSGSSS